MKEKFFSLHLFKKSLATSSNELFNQILCQDLGKARRGFGKFGIRVSCRLDTVATYPGCWFVIYHGYVFLPFSASSCLIRQSGKKLRCIDSTFHWRPSRKLLDFCSSTRYPERPSQRPSFFIDDAIPRIPHANGWQIPRIQFPKKPIEFFVSKRLPNQLAI